MRILVTGGAGFIGSHLCKALLDQGHQVWCLDNLFSGNIDNLRDMMKNESFTFIEANVTKGCPVDVKFDRIYHLACPASPSFYQKDPLDTLDTCYIGTKRMLQLAKKYNSRMLLTSTSEVYGDPKEHPQPETYNGNVSTTSIRACYDEGKRIGETLMAEYNRMHGVDTRVARIFNTYGPNLNPDDGRVVSNFICQALKNENITVYGDGSQTRSLCYVSDTVRGLIELMEYEGAKKHTAFNIGNPVEITILQLAELTIKLTQSKSHITFHPLPSHDPTKRKPDIRKAQKYLAWTPKVEQNKGLKKTIRYFESLLM